MGLSVSMLYKWAEPPEEGSGALNPLDRIGQLLEFTGDKRIAGWVCQRANGVFIENSKPAKDRLGEELTAATTRTVEEFGEMLAEIGVAARDGEITANEAAELREQWERLKSITERFVRCCEEGRFEEMHAKRKE